MKHAIFAAVGALTVAGTVTLAAQTPQTPQRPQTPTPSPTTPARTDDKTITATGCLKAWDASMDAGRPGSTTAPGSTTPSTAAAQRFVLSDVEPDTKGTMGSTPGSTGSTAGSTASQPGAKATGKQYVLVADGVNLTPHLNHKVRVTGKVTEMADHSASGHTTTPAPTPDPSRPGETPRTGDRMAMDKAWSTIAVSSVTMVSATCTGATN